MIFSWNQIRIVWIYSLLFRLCLYSLISIPTPDSIRFNSILFGFISETRCTNWDACVVCIVRFNRKNKKFNSFLCLSYKQRKKEVFHYLIASKTQSEKKTSSKARVWMNYDNESTFIISFLHDMKLDENKRNRNCIVLFIKFRVCWHVHSNGDVDRLITMTASEKW